MLIETPSTAWGQDKKGAGKAIDPATVAAYERLGGEYGGYQMY